MKGKLLAFELRAWQRTAKDIWLEKRSGVVEVVTGGGKTIFALDCAQGILEQEPNTKVLVIVPTQALADQWFVEITSFLGIADQDVAFLTGSQPAPPEHRFAICVINSARTAAVRYCETYPTFLVVDECHRAGSPENARALVGRHIATLGLSATPQRQYDEGFERYIVPALGPVIYRYTYVEAARDGVLAAFSLINLEVDLLSDERLAYRDLSKRIAVAYARGNEEAVESLLQRRAAVSTNAAMRVPVAARLIDQHKGERAVVFHERTEAADTICANLRARGHRATVYHTGIGTSLRRDNLRLFRKGIFDVLVCCKALDEGINVPETQVGILASSTASNRQRIQRLGRLLRPAAGKTHATICTIFATDEEKKRLLEEKDRLEGISEIRWQKASLGRNG